MNIRKNICIFLLVIFTVGFYNTAHSQTTDTLVNGLIGHWKFDSIDMNALTTPDNTGGTGAIGTSSRLVSGKFGQALRLDLGGSQQFMTAKTNFSSPQWSVSTWVNPDLPIATSSPYFGSITFFSADPTASGVSQMLLITKDDIRTYQTKIANYSFANNPGWRHVVVTYNGTTLTAYVDGVSRGSLAYSNILANNIKRYIGTNSAQARGHVFVGAIDESRLYNRVLDAAEITALFNNRANTVTTTPVATTTTPVVVATTTTPRIATTTTVAPQVLAPVLPTVPTIKITGNLTATTNKTIYRLGETVRTTATFTIDPAWVTYLRARSDTRAEVFFEMKDSTTNTFLVQVPIAFDLANTSITRTYDWATPATNTALAGKTFSASVTVRDASRAVTESRVVNNLSFEALPPSIPTVYPRTEDGVTVIEENLPSRTTSPDIFAGVLASRDLLPSEFVITNVVRSNFATTTGTVLPVIFRYNKNNPDEDKARARFTAPGRLNLSDYNVVDIVMENTLVTPITITLQATEQPNSTDYFQAKYLLPANSGPRHLLLPFTRELFKCNSVTGTDDCPMSPRQAVLTSEHVQGNPNKGNILEIRVFADNMTQGSELKVYSMKAMNISYAPQYLRNYIDKYGQNNWVNFPEKITSDAQLQSDARSERTTLRPLPDQWDIYGGDKNATGYGATGKFKVQKVNGKWWLVNPLGNLTYISAVTQVDYTLTPGYVGDPTSAKRGAFIELDRTGLLNNAFKDNQACHSVGVSAFCGGTTWSAYTSNIIKKYSSANSTFAEIEAKWRLNQQNRLREWGFNVITDRYAEYISGWRTGIREIPFITQFNLKGKENLYQKVSGMDRVPDPFDPRFETEVNNIMNRYFNTPYPGTGLTVKDDPYAIGSAPDNEIPWGLGEDTNLRNVYIVVLRILEQNSSQYSKIAFTNILKEKYSNNFEALKTAWDNALPSNINSWDAFQNNPVVINGSISSNIRSDLSDLLEEFARKYLTVTKTAIKRYGGEGHLFTGVRFANFYRTPTEVIDACAEICDIISINYYNYTTADRRESWNYLLAKDKPILITEFYFDSPSRGSAGTVKPETTTDQEQADAFERYVRDILNKDQVIGYSYHDIYDQPLLGSIWTENNLSGFVSETDRPYPKLVEAAKDVNFDIYRLRGSRRNGETPTSRSVTVGKTGAGSGTVSGGTISCGQTCQNVFSVGSTVTLTATPASGSTFVGWSGSCTGTGACTLTMNGDKVVSAEFRVAPQTVTLTVAKVGTGTVTATGINCGADCTETVNVGTNITLTATPAAEYRFTGWSACTGTGTCTVPMSIVRTVTATFTRINTAPVARPVSVRTTGAPVSIVLVGDDNEGDTLTFTPGVAPTRGALSRNANGTYTYTINTPIPTTGFTDGFNYNANDGRLTGPVARVTIDYIPSTYTLTATKTGNGTITGTQINCGADCTGTYNTNSVVALTATPATGNVFSGWSGACTGTGACNVTMNAAKTVTATFNPITYSVNVSKVGNGTVSGGTISCGTTCQNIFNYGSTVTLTATPAAGQTFTGWTGACTLTTGTCNLTVDGNKIVIANFAVTNTVPVTQNMTYTIASPATTANIVLSGTDAQNDQLTYTTGVAPTKGTLRRNPDGSYTYTINAPIPTTGFTDGFNYNANDGRLTSAASRVTINYTITPPTIYTMTVSKVGNGTVTAPGIACGGDCQGDFTKDTNAVLTATPATGHTFTGWTGACTGTTCTVLMNGAKTATATFTKINTAPVASPVNATVNTSGTALLTLVGTDIDNGDTLTYTPGTPTNGTLARSEDGKYTYTIRSPRPAALTVDRFTYTVSDGRITSAPATIAVTIPALPNEPPRTVDTDGDGVIDGNDLCPNTPPTLRTKVDRYGCPRPKITTFDIKPATDTLSFKSMVNAVIGKTNVGNIRFNQNVDLTRDTTELDVDSNILITDKRVEVRSANVPELNKPATITLYNITEKNPKILRNGVECPPTVCTNKTLVNGVLTFTVNGF
jgi:uncharacterized repeat protein (TIGR02543 family)